jgi:hypothetical protein
MVHVEFTERELMLTRSALRSFLDDFGHKEQDLLDEIKTLIQKLPEPGGADPAGDQTTVTEL